jgi:hypothetical protein
MNLDVSSVKRRGYIGSITKKIKFAQQNLVQTSPVKKKRNIFSVCGDKKHRHVHEDGTFIMSYSLHTKNA